MSEHYTEATESILKWCNHCQRQTVHTVSGGRVGRCTEHDSPKFSKAQLAARARQAREAANPRLFV